MSEPYIRKLPNELIRAADWNQIQIEARNQIEEIHDHTGGTQGRQLGTGALVDGAITTDKLGLGAVTADKIGPGAVTADKLAPGVVTTDKLAPGAVTSDRLATSLSLSELAVSGRPVRPSFDHASFEWSWTYTQSTAEIRNESFLMDGMGALFTHASALARGEQYPPFLRALRLITSHIETDWIYQLGIYAAFERARDPRLERALTNHGLTQQDTDDALSTIEVAYQHNTPNWCSWSPLIAVARLGDMSAMEKVSSVTETGELLSLLQQYYASSSVLAAYRNEVLAATALVRGLPLPGSYNWYDGLVLPEAPDELAVMDVEMTVEVSATHPTVLGIGSGYTWLPQPGQFYAVSPGTHRISMRRRMPLLQGLYRTAFLCGVVDDGGAGIVEPTRILNLHIAARTYPGEDTLDSGKFLQSGNERPLPEKPSMRPRDSTTGTATDPTRTTTDPIETPPIISQPEEA